MFWVWSGHDFDQMFGTSILDWNPFPECCGRCSKEPASNSKLQICSGFNKCVLFSKHDLETLWETRMQISSDETPADVSGLNSQVSSKKCPVAFAVPRAWNRVLLSRVVIYDKMNKKHAYNSATSRLHFLNTGLWQFVNQRHRSFAGSDSFQRPRSVTLCVSWAHAPVAYKISQNICTQKGFFVSTVHTCSGCNLWRLFLLKTYKLLLIQVSSQLQFPHK